MEFIKNILKGMVIGLANIIPGVSGGTLMVSMNIYDRLISAITHLFTQLKKSLALLIPIFIGMGIAIIGSSFGIEYLFDQFPIQTNLLFIGLILGGIPAIYNKTKGHKIRVGYIVSFAIFFILVVGLALLEGTTGADARLEFTVGGVIMLFLIGVLASATMVIPGVSGSMILLLVGYYNPIISEINDFIRALTSMDMPGIIRGFELLVPFGLGVLIGIFAIAKLMETIFRRFPQYAFWGILGLIVASPVAIILMNASAFAGLTVVSILTGIIALALGVFIAMKLGEQ